MTLRKSQNEFLFFCMPELTILAPYQAALQRRERDVLRGL